MEGSVEEKINDKVYFTPINFVEHKHANLYRQACARNLKWDMFLELNKRLTFFSRSKILKKCFTFETDS